MHFIDSRGAWGKEWYGRYHSECSVSKVPEFTGCTSLVPGTTLATGSVPGTFKSGYCTSFRES